MRGFGGLFPSMRRRWEGFSCVCALVGEHTHTHNYNCSLTLAEAKEVKSKVVKADRLQSN